MKYQLAIFTVGDDVNGYSSLCPELDLMSQGKTFEEAQCNLQEAVKLFLKHASPEEVEALLSRKVSVEMPEGAELSFEEFEVATG